MLGFAAKENQIKTLKTAERNMNNFFITKNTNKNNDVLISLLPQKANQKSDFYSDIVKTA